MQIYEDSLVGFLEYEQFAINNLYSLMSHWACRSVTLTSKVSLRQAQTDNRKMILNLLTLETSNSILRQKFKQKNLEQKTYI